MTAEPALKQQRPRLRPSGQLRIALTGFGPFPGVPFNATAQLVEEVRAAGLRLWRRPQLVTHTLPTDWRQALPQLRALLDATEPDVALHFGVSSRARGFVIETVAANRTSERLDCAGAAPLSRCVRPNAAPVLKATVPVALLVQRLRAAGIAAQLSSDAGRYLCNAVLYESILAAQALSRPRLAGFVHIPVLGQPGEKAEAGRFGWSELRKGAAIILDTLARHALSGQGAPRPAGSGRPCSS